MSTANLLNGQFDDSDDEEDFNPQPADISDAEEGGDSDHDEDAGAQIQNEAANRRVNDEGSEDGSQKNAGGDDEEDEGEEDGEPTAARDDDDEEEEDDEDEIETVRLIPFQRRLEDTLLPEIPSMAHENTQART
jgi:transcription elongation factor SPT5